MSELCPVCTHHLAHNIYCYECGYDVEVEEAIANAQPLLIDQIPEDGDGDDIYE